MANTCADCNNGLGSRTEAAMQDWYDSAVTARFTTASSRAPFGHGRIIFLKTDAAEPVLLVEAPAPHGSSPFDRLTEPNLQMHCLAPRPAEYKTGLLKSAYLAVCLHFGGVPHTESTLAARAELLAARDARSRAEVQLGPIAASLQVHRTHRAASGPPLALLADEIEGVTTYLLSLAGTLFVEWPFPDLNPMWSPRLHA